MVQGLGLRNGELPEENRQEGYMEEEGSLHSRSLETCLRKGFLVPERVESLKCWFYVRNRSAWAYSWSSPSLELHLKRLLSRSSSHNGWVRAVCFQHWTLHRVGSWCPGKMEESQALARTGFCFFSVLMLDIVYTVLSVTVRGVVCSRLCWPASFSLPLHNSFWT